MKDDLVSLLKQVAEHPASYGLLAGIARWLTGDRQGGWWVFLNYLASSCLVAWAAAFYLADEPLTQAKRVFFLLLLAFIARDLLNILLLLVDKAKGNPLEFFQRLLNALRGGGTGGGK